ncbi:MAG: hypothetical protein ACLQJL_03045 [Roseiarcus sp.]
MRRILLFGAALALMGCNGHVDGASFAEGPDGVRCSAKVLAVADTGVTIDEDPVAQLTLLVSPPPGAPPFDATIEATVSRLAIPRNGDRLPVVCDPLRPADTELIEE